MRRLNFGILLAIAVLALCPAFTTAADSSEQNEDRAAFWQQKSAGKWSSEEATDAAAAQLKAELYNVQLWLERWAVDHQVEDGNTERHWGNNYPSSINQLMQSPCCPEHPQGGSYGVPGFYPNPYTNAGSNGHNALCLPFGWTSQHAGNFSYITQYNELGNVCAYVLLGYADDRHAGHDIDGDGKPDGVVIMLAGGEPMNQDGLLRRLWNEQQREEAVLMYWDNGYPVELNWPK